MALFLGNEVDATGKVLQRLELDPADLLTHGLVVGMTRRAGLGVLTAANF